MSDYSQLIQNALKKQHTEIGNDISIEKDDQKHEGILMPNTGDPNCIVIKLVSGYNIGIVVDEKTKIKKTSAEKHAPKKHIINVSQSNMNENAKHFLLNETSKSKLKHDPNKPTIAILNAGGTIASRIDYRTGATTPVFDADDLVAMVPELNDIANIRCRVLFQMFSEDMEPDHWIIMAKEIAKEIEEGCDGIIITHGTDTMHYTSAALALMIQNLPIPVLIVGSQRSSDRGSSDAAMNLICAASFISQSNFAGIAICMHGSSSDDYCNILPACKSRKMHASRRNAFRPINTKPIARIDYNNTRKIEYYYKNSKGISNNKTAKSRNNETDLNEQSDYKLLKKDPKRIPRLETRFDNKTALIKIHPGFKAEQLRLYENYHGLIIEGFGIAGNMPINVLDKHTEHHAELLKVLEELTKKGIAIYMTTQCIYGRINMNVYTTGRDMQTAGAKPAYMTPETAFVKLGWVLAHTRDPKDVDKLMQTDIAGEIIERSELDEFPDKKLEK